MTGPSWSRSLAANCCRGIRSGGRARSWPSLKASARASWPSGCSAMSRRFVAHANAIESADSTGCWTLSSDQADRPGFPPLQRAEIVKLACLEPIAQGLHITHWTSKELARQAVERGIVPAISDRTVRTMLHQVDLQPHRTRYWRTS